MPQIHVEPDAVFLNVPYDEAFQPLYLAYIVGLVELGLRPKATLAIPGGTARLDRIFRLIRSCRYSIHDLSRVELDRNPPYPTPRFNMPFELGLAVSWTKLESRRHTFFVAESVPYRAQKSISDLNGIDPYVHNNTPEGVLRELLNCFVRERNRPTLPRLRNAYNTVADIVLRLTERGALGSLYEARSFDDLIAVAARQRDLHRLRRRNA